MGNLLYLGNEISQIEELLILIFLTAALCFISKYSFEFIEHRKGFESMKSKLQSFFIYDKRDL